jgi:hypothetical protein
VVKLCGYRIWKRCKKGTQIGEKNNELVISVFSVHSYTKCEVLTSDFPDNIDQVVWAIGDNKRLYLINLYVSFIPPFYPCILYDNCP